MSSAHLGVDVGGTQVRAALVADDGSIMFSEAAPTRTPGGVDPGMHISLATAQSVAARAAREGIHIKGVGVGVPEYVRDNRLRSDLVLAWTTQPEELFAEIASVTVESDVRCGALAESRFGAGRGCGSLLYVSVGTGISCALVLNGSIWPGHRGEAIALGELPIERSLETDGAPTLEEFASGSAIARRYESATGRSVDGARTVIARADSDDDAPARLIMETSAQALGSALAWAVDLVDPQIVVVGGGLGSSGGRWFDLVRRSYLPLSRPSAPELVPASLGSTSGVVGAAIAASERSR